MRVCLVLFASGFYALAGYERSHQAEEKENCEELRPAKEVSATARDESSGVDSTLTIKEAEALLARGIGHWKGIGVAKDAEGEVLAQIPLVARVRWLKEGDKGFRKIGGESAESKVQEMRVTEKLPQGDQELVFTRWYDSGKGLFLLTRRLAGEEPPGKPGAEETYDAEADAYLGIVREGLQRGGSFTWRSQMTNEKWIYRGRFLQDSQLQWTRVDRLSPVKVMPSNPEAP